MGVEETSSINITCDNPNCPGNDMDPTDRTGWIFVTHEVYGQPTQSNVYCCAECAGTLSDVIAAAEAEATPAEPTTSAA